MPGITLDIFNNDAFSFTSLTARVNTEIPYVPGQVGALAIFEEQGVTTRSVAVEERDGQLALVAPSKIGGPGETVGRNDDKLRSFAVPHFQRDDAVMAEEVQGRRAFGTTSDVETVLSVLDRKVARHTRDFDMTLEFMRVGAIKGNVLNKFGGSIANLYQAFEISVPDDFQFELGSDATIVRKKSEQLGRMIENELDVHYSGLHAFCGDAFWDALTNHKSVREVWLWAQKVAEQLGKQAMTVDIGPIRYERYRTGKKGSAAGVAAVGGNGAFIASNECRVVPVGVPELFITRFAPADYMETVNTEGLPRYVKQIPMDNGKGVNLEIQTNPISLCTRPGVLRRGVL